MGKSVLNNKRLLAVDDEPDVLETLEEQLSDFDGLIFDRATDYDTGYQLIRSWTYDLVILDIMGGNPKKIYRDGRKGLHSQGKNVRNCFFPRRCFDPGAPARLAAFV